MAGYHLARAQVSSPCEDRLVETRIHGAGGSAENVWLVWGVFNGHGGWETAELLARNLPRFVQQSLQSLQPGAHSDLVMQAVVESFMNLDDALVKTALSVVADPAMTFTEKAVHLTPCYSGSCALLLVLDPSSMTLYTACTGDSRALHGRQGSDGKWEAVPLSTDQGGSNPDEVARIEAEHPGEADIVRDDRVLGLMPARAFGDGKWKWPLDFLGEVRERFNGPVPLPTERYKTPPYLTAAPVVTATTITPGENAFVILATDGLWDTMSSQRGVDLVAGWLDWVNIGKPGRRAEERLQTREPFDLAPYPPGVMWQVEEKNIAFEDDNAAVHLIRNALGGGHLEKLSGALAFPPPHSRTVRDDMGVQVIFFT